MVDGTTKYPALVQTRTSLTSKLFQLSSERSPAIKKNYKVVSSILQKVFKIITINFIVYIYWDTETNLVIL